MPSIFVSLLTLLFFLSGPTTEGKFVFRQSAVVAMMNGRLGHSAISIAISGPWADANPFRFSSQYYHAPSGLHVYACRFYDPGLQRWLTPDPLGEVADSNLYRFVGNDPVNRIDPLGLDYRSVAQMNIFGVIPGPNGIVPYVTGDTWGEQTVAAIDNK